MRIAMAQISMRNNMNENYKKTLNYIEQAQGSDLMFFPALQLTPFFPQLSGLNAQNAVSRQSDARLRGICYQAHKYHMYISPSVYLEQYGHLYQASLWYDKNGDEHEPSKMVHVMDRENFHEADYYEPSDGGFIVHKTSMGNIGVVIGFDRHYPESIRSCAVQGAELIIIPAANHKDEDLEMTEWELRVQAMQNQVYIAMCNRVGKEGYLTFAGESVVIGPDGQVIFKADDTEQLIKLDLDMKKVRELREKNPMLAVRKPNAYTPIARE